jgi:hypothetical protein
MADRAGDDGCPWRGGRLANRWWISFAPSFAPSDAHGRRVEVKEGH